MRIRTVLCAIAIAMSATPSLAADQTAEVSTTKRALIAAIAAPTSKITVDIESSAVAKSAAGAAAFALDVVTVSLGEAPTELDRGLSLCGADAPCIGARLESAGFALGLFLVANLSSAPPLITGRVIDAHGVVLGSSVWELDTAKSDIAVAIASDTFELLEKSGLRIGARIVVEASPADASVSVIDAAKGGTVQAPLTNVFLVNPGTYRVRAVRDGYVESSAEVTAGRARETRVRLALASSPSVLESPWLWIGAGVAAIGAVAAYAVIRHNGEPLTLCQAPNRSCP